MFSAEFLESISFIDSSSDESSADHIIGADDQNKIINGENREVYLYCKKRKFVLPGYFYKFKEMTQS